MKKLHYVLLATTLTICQSLHAVDLMTLHEEALASSPRVAIAASDLKASQARARQALGGLLPQVSFTAKETRTYYQGNRADEYYNGESYQLSLTQDIFNKAKFNNKEAFDYRVGEAEENYLALVATLSVDLLDRYTAVLSAEDVLSQITSEKELTASELKAQKSMFGRQLAMLTDVLDIEARLDNLVAQEIAAKNKVEIARAALGELVGYDVTLPLSGFSQSFEYADFEERDKDYWVAQGLQFNHELKGLDKKMQAAEAAARSAGAAHLPTVFLQLSANRSNIGYENASSADYESNVASINLNMPLYSGGTTTAKANEMTAEYERARGLYEEKKRLVVKNIQEAYLNVSANVASIRASVKAISSAQKSSDAMEKGYQYGTATIIDVLDSKKQVLKQQIEYRQRQYDYVVNYLNLLSLSGQFNESSIYQINNWLVK